MKALSITVLSSLAFASLGVIDDAQALTRLAVASPYADSAQDSMRRPPLDETRTSAGSSDVPPAPERGGASDAAGQDALPGGGERTVLAQGRSSAPASSTSSSSASSPTSPPSSAESARSASSNANGPSDGAARSRAGESEDAAFVRQAMESDAQEIADAQHAQNRAKRSEVRDVAQMLHRDHTTSSRKLTALAKGKTGVPQTPGTPAALNSPGPGTTMSEGDFDRTYLEQQIRAHERSIALFRKQATQGTDPDLRKFAQETLPTLERHLAELNRVQQGSPQRQSAVTR